MAGKKFKEDMLVKRHYPDILRLARHYHRKYRLNCTAIDSLDIAQESCIVMLMKHRRGQRFNKKYIARIVQAKTIDMLRKEIGRCKARPVFLDLFENSSSEKYLYYPYDSIDNKIMAGKIFDMVQTSTFKDDEKEAFYMSYYGGHYQKEISSHMGYVQSNVSNKISRVREYVQSTFIGA